MQRNIRKRKVGLVVILVILILIGFRAVRKDRSDVGVPNLPGDNGSSSSGDSITNTQIVKSFDCTQSSCRELAISGERLATLPNGNLSNVRGMADPSIRKDPFSNRLWLAYSWVGPKLSGNRVVGAEVDNHLARSDDGGKSWSLVKTMWEAGTNATDSSGNLGHMNSETISLAPNPNGTWYSSRFVYFTPDGGSPQVKSFTTHIAAANSPEQLSTAEEAVLGGDLTENFWKADINLASLNNDLDGCTFFDAGMVYHNSQLYLGVQCVIYGRTGTNRGKSFVALFSTQPNGTPKNWTWKYEGKIADSDEAVAFGGENLTQTDLAVSQDGKLLAIMSPSDDEGKGVLDQHYGCYAVEIASTNPLKLARDSEGNVKVRAKVTASDLTAPRGTSASCGYDAASATGILMARRIDEGGLNSTLNQTGLHP